jgi:hypothetical protein
MTVMKTAVQSVDARRAAQLREEEMIRMRWRLWFLFAESRYTQFAYKGNPKKPCYAKIREYCIRHWGREIGDMTRAELSRFIGIVRKWK